MSTPRVRSLIPFPVPILCAFRRTLVGDVVSDGDASDDDASERGLQKKERMSFAVGSPCGIRWKPKAPVCGFVPFPDSAGRFSRHALPIARIASISPSVIPSTSPLPEIAAYLARQKRVKKVRMPRRDEMPPELQEIMHDIAALTRAWNPVEIYTADPDSIAAEHERFFAAFRRNEEYNPRFTYSYADSFLLGDSRAKLESLLVRLGRFKAEGRTLSIAKLGLHFKIKDDLATCDLVEGLQRRDDGLIAQALQYKYPGTDRFLLRIAQEDFDRRTRETDPPEEHTSLLNARQKAHLRALRFGAEDFRTAFTWALEQYGILRTEGSPAYGFNVVIDARATAIDVRDKSVLGPTVFIPTSTQGNGESLLRLIAHEIEGHARQSANGEQLFLFGGGELKIDDETLYEGLAMRHEHEFHLKHFGDHDGSPLPDIYTFAVHMAENGASFAEIFREQRRRQLHLFLHVLPDDDLPHVVDPALLHRVERLAWRTTYRVMRGHVDTSNKARFAMAKDLAYLRGWILDRQLRAHGHGHVNEAAISSIGALRVLAEFSLSAEDLPHPYKDVTSEYLGKLLETVSG